MLADLWERKQADVVSQTKAMKAKLHQIDSQIDQCLDRIVETKVSSITRALENKVQKLENEKLVLQERIANVAAPEGDLDRRVGSALAFLQSP